MVYSIIKRKGGEFLVSLLVWLLERLKYGGNSMTQRPVEEKKFEIRPMELLLCRRFFEELSVVRRSREETLKKDILKALTEVERKPQKYFSPFYTMIPAKTWDCFATTRYMELYASVEKGGRLADFTEQSLEWAQRLFNGETMNDLVRLPDTANWFRLVSKGNSYAVVGGCTGDPEQKERNIPPALYAYGLDIPYYHIYGEMIVPLIVYKK